MLAALVLLTGWGCHPPPEVVFEAVHQLLDDIPERAHDDAPPSCSIAGDIRPALGCLPEFPLGTETGIHVAGEQLLRHYRVPPALAAGAFVVTPSIRFSRPKTWITLAGQEFPGPRASIDMELRLPAAARGQTLELTVTASAIPPPKQVTKTRAVTIGPGAFLRAAIAIAPVGRRGWAAPIEFRLIARSRGVSTELLRRVLDPIDEEGVRWNDLRLDLTALPRARTRFAFTSRVLAGRGPAFSVPLWGAPRVLEPRPQGARRNLLLVSVDTLRADHVGAYGSDLPTTPALDRLAEEGALFEHAIAAYPSTTASHASMLTGVYPSVHGVFGLYDRLPANIPTLAELLAVRGYETAAVTEDGFVLAAVGFPRGFNDYRELKTANLWDAKGQAAATFAGGLSWLQAHRGEKFFLFLHTYQVHSPYTPPPDFDLFESYREAGRDIPITDRTPASIRCRHKYAGEVRYLDSELRRLLDGLATLGEADRTVVVVTADHGEEFGEHGGAFHGATLYDEVLRVPFILRAPGLVPAGVRTAVPVSLIDLVPTVLDLLGLPVPPTAQGRSLAPLLQGASSSALADRVLFTEVKKEPNATVVFDSTPGHGDGCAFRVVRDKSSEGLVHHFVGVRSGTSMSIHELPDGPAEAYDLRADPGEHHNVTTPARAAFVRAAARTFLEQASLVRSRLEAREQRRERAPAPDERTLEKLRALGYVN